MDKKERQIYQKEYYAKNKQIIKEKAKIYYEKNKEKYSRRQKIYNRKYYLERKNRIINSNENKVINNTVTF